MHGTYTHRITCNLYPDQFFMLNRAANQFNSRLAPFVRDAALAYVSQKKMLRPKEVSHLEWGRIDFEERAVVLEPTIRVGGKVKNLVKNRHTHRVPLSHLALEVIERLRPLTGHFRWVLPSTADPTMPAVKFHKARHRFCRAAGVEDMQMRDLRATGATILAERWEYEEHVIAVILNHKPRNVTGKVYLRHKARYFNQVREALDRLGSYINGITSGEGAQVVSIAGR